MQHFQCIDSGLRYSTILKLLEEELRLGIRCCQTISQDFSIEIVQRRQRAAWLRAIRSCAVRLWEGLLALKMGCVRASAVAVLDAGKIDGVYGVDILVCDERSDKASYRVEMPSYGRWKLPTQVM